MRIVRDVYHQVLGLCAEQGRETGGIIGGQGDLVGQFVFDAGASVGELGSYSPDITCVNRCLENWYQQGVAFLGIVHSHFQSFEQLSSGDRQYIQNILQAMPPLISRLYFPIVFPCKSKIVSFVAERRYDGTTEIQTDGITII